ncbi:PHD-zinc-finger like domain/PHD-like zinc-binding domain containing protein [Leishmania donovani]|uniref:PHD-like zinc-binding domain family protein n=1 Tax=Leishmania donovani TaxID=5661 RepID=A0A504XP42_LEIDO|nr:PHD-like zinc-binding domain family protein [Leishmania donovani]CAJ1993274.1 PHD-zinc-finger like domain/PHD-like zinc-binding domain containing protein [Leishmania donovani]VDZ49101.1 PHD-zinc-finger_like_domain/PHD-like_zinc-binding_domain_containing_protein_putative/Pfam:PF13832/Pfam:PF13771 [Leishmania donovani]
MSRAVKPVKRVTFGPVTYFSAPLIEASQGSDSHESSRLVDALALRQRVSRPATVAIVASGAAPPLQNEVDGLLRAGELEEYAAQPTLFLGAAVDKPHAALSSVQQAANVATEDNWEGGDTEDQTPVSHPRATPATSSVTRQESSDNEAYDTPVESRPATRRHLMRAARLDGAGTREPPPSILEKSPTLSQLVSAVDDVLGGSQRTPRSPLAASSSAFAPRGSCYSTEAAAERSSTTNSFPPTPMSLAKVQKTDAYDTREAGGCADPLLAARCMLHHREGDESITASGSAVALIVPHNASDKVHPSFCVFCGIGANCGNAHETLPLCFSDDIAYHTACALWCPEVFYDIELGTLKGIADAAHRARLIKCAWCRQPGAGVGCAWPTCQLSFHVPCAVKARASINVQAFVLYCPAHRSATVSRTAADQLGPPGGEAALKRTKVEERPGASRFF